MQAGSGGHYGAFVGGVDGLEGVNVHFFRLAADVFGQRRLSHAEEHAFEFVVRAVVEEPQCAAAGCGVVYHFGHE